MNHLQTDLLAAVLCAVVLADASTAPAPSLEPARNGNIWDGFDHQPTAAGEQALEQQAGMTWNSAERRRELRALSTINQKLLGQPLTPPVPAPPSAPR